MIAGYVTQESVRKELDGTVHEEIQVFRGNKDLNGEAFKYIDRKAILKTSRPDSLLLVERLEYGPAIVTPVALETPSGRIEAGTPEFRPALEAIIARSGTGKSGHAAHRAQADREEQPRNAGTGARREKRNR